MKVKLIFDTSTTETDVDPIVAEGETLEDAFAEICNELETAGYEFPNVETVKILGKDGRDVTNEFNEFWEEY